MRLDDFLTAPLPDVRVDTEDALARTRARGAQHRRHRRVLTGLGAALVVTAGAAAALQLTGDLDGGGAGDRVTTGSDPSAAATSGPTPSSSGPVPPSAEPEAGDTATWRIDPAELPTPSDTTVTVLVTRVDCHSGETGRVLQPGVVFDDTSVAITFTVEAEASSGAFTCQGNDEVAQEVDLGQAIGERALVDGGCLAGGGVEGYESFCPAGSGVRWQPLQPPLREVTGVLVIEGGPASAGTTPVPGTIQVFDDAGRPVATASADDAGRFTLQLPDGTYQLVGYSPRYVDGEWSCHTTDTVTVADTDTDTDDVAVICEAR